MCDRRPTVDVFIAVSYKAACVMNPTMSFGYRQALEKLVQCFERLQLNAYLAPREEHWGKQRPPRDIGISRDMLALYEASTFVFFPYENDSDGALVELGVAIALKKPVWILQRESDATSYVTGLLELGLANAKHIESYGAITKFVSENWSQNHSH